MQLVNSNLAYSISNAQNLNASNRMRALHLCALSIREVGFNWTAYTIKVDNEKKKPQTPKGKINVFSLKQCQG